MVTANFYSKTAHNYDTGFEKGISMMKEETLSHRLWISSKWTDTAEGKGKEIRLLEYACGPGHITRVGFSLLNHRLGLSKHRL
jgi:hypothetical protein